MMLEEYYKKNVDVQIDWLLYLNSFSNLKATNLLTNAPIIESIREEAYKEVSSLNGETNTLFINNQIKLIISSLLIDKNLKKLSSYVGYGLLDNKAVNYSLSLFLSKVPIYIDLDNIFIENIENIELRDCYNVECINVKTLYTFFESLRIKEGIYSINDYINTILANIQLMNLNDKDKVEKIVELELELNKKKTIEEIGDLINIINDLDETKIYSKIRKNKKK